MLLSEAYSLVAVLRPAEESTGKDARTTFPGPAAASTLLLIVQQATNIPSKPRENEREHEETPGCFIVQFSE